MFEGGNGTAPPEGGDAETGTARSDLRTQNHPPPFPIPPAGGEKKVVSAWARRYDPGMGDRPAEFWESLAERRIREAAEEGAFDDLPGAGEPLPGLHGPYDPDWWVKEWLRRTSLEDTIAEVLHTIRRELPRLEASPHSAETSRRLTELNETIEALNRELPTRKHLDPIEL